MPPFEVSTGGNDAGSRPRLPDSDWAAQGVHICCNSTPAVPDRHNNGQVRRDARQQHGRVCRGKLVGEATGWLPSPILALHAGVSLGRPSPSALPDLIHDELEVRLEIAALIRNRFLPSATSAASHFSSAPRAAHRCLVEISPGGISRPTRVACFACNSVTIILRAVGGAAGQALRGPGGANSKRVAGIGGTMPSSPP